MNASLSSAAIAAASFVPAVFPRPARPVLGPPRPLVFTPLHTLWLAGEGVGLKAQLIALQTKITALEEQARAAQAQHSRDAEKIAALVLRNQQLTTAIHRTACAG
ncbi:hypothetical protein [Prosthecobacter sp.]|uniref:hypothetical protein n=1 Tax=Prosthecobacter sp. TaxID=1965333 RepID=UPI00378363F0